jgi:stage III sporulation protein AD
MEADIIKIAAIGIIGAILAVILKDTRKDFALLVSIMTGILIFTIVAGQLSRSLAAMIRILDGFQIDFVYLDVLFKIIAVSYIAKFAAQVCQDAGEGSVAVKVELAAKIIIIALSLPVVNALLKLVADILP